MSGQQDALLLEDLKQQIVTRHAVFIVGAGVSIAATNDNRLASWTGLLKDGVERCEAIMQGDLPRDWGDIVRRELACDDVDSLLSAASKVESRLKKSPGEYPRWLRETVGSLTVEYPDVIECLFRLDTPLITTNYDGLLELESGLPAVTWRQSAAVERVLNREEPGVVHIHGHYSDPESVVLGIRSYESVLRDDHLQAMLRALRAMRTLVFVGYGQGLRDPNFAALMEWSRRVFRDSERRHFRFARQDECDLLRREHSPEDHVFVVGYGRDYRDLTSFLRSLTDRPATSDKRTSKPRPRSAKSDAKEKPCAGGSREFAADTDGCCIDVTLDRDFDSFTQSDQERFLAALRELLALTHNLRVVQKTRGSVVLRLHGNREDMDRIVQAWRDSELARLGVRDVREASSGPRSQDAQSFHAFMVYNSRDRSAAAWIHEQLAHRGLNVWVDYDHIFGGDALGSVIVDGMKASKTVIVLFSPEGLGSWGDEELRTIQNLYLSKQITKVIPVLLPGVAELPDILAVAGHRYVRFSDSLDDEPAVFNELERSITGREARASRRYFEIHVEVPFPGEGCFVASPAEPGDVRYDAIVRAIQSTGMAVLHNRDGSLPNFYADVAQGVRAAEVVVVDYGAISGQCVPAPEVVYELGLANALGKPTLVLTNGQCRLPTVVTVRRLLEYGDEELASGAFETRLAEAIKTVAGGLCYPFLTEVDLDDIYAIPNRLATLRFAVWRRLRNVLLFGIRLHDCFRDVSKHAHKLERDIQRVVHDRSDLRQMANCELHQRNWRVFEATFSQDYLRAHHTVEETYAELRSSGSSDVEQSFVFLASVLVGPLRELIDDSRGYYELAMNTLRAYFDIHDGLVPRMAGPGAPNNERAPLLSALCGELSRQAHLVNTQVSEMMTTLLELIAKDQEIGGAKHAHTRGHSHGNKADEHGAGSTPSAARSS